MERIFDIRFIIPPVFTLFFVILFSPQDFFKLFIDYKNHELISVLTGSLLILALGIIISSIGNFFVVKFNLRSCYDKKYEKVLRSNFFSKEKSMDRKKDADILELGSWLILGSFDKHLQEQIHKRWNWAMAGLNYIVAIDSALIIIFGFLWAQMILPGTQWNLWWSFFTIILVYIFYFNTDKNRKSVNNMDKSLAKNYKQILANLNKNEER